MGMHEIKKKKKKRNWLLEFFISSYTRVSELHPPR